MTSFVLKIIALVCMFCDHFGDALLGKISFLNLIGRIAFPIFAFQISEGFIHTKNIKKYSLRLFIFAIISQLPFYLFMKNFNPSGMYTLNIFFTLLIGLGSIYFYNYFFKVDNKELKKKLFGISIGNLVGFIFVFIFAFIAQIINVDYGGWGILVIFAFYYFRNNKSYMILAYISLCLIRYGFWIVLYGLNIYYILFCIFTILPIFLIWLYNGKQGIKLKYFLYIFYPLHLLLLSLFM